MIRFVHSADWQLGARFAQFGAVGAALRAARFETLRRALTIARQRQADAFFIAGDLFEDNQVAESLVAEIVALFSEFAPLPIFLLPGNHDPLTGPEAVWARRSWVQAANVRILERTEAIDLGGAWLLAAPLRQKISTLDPSLPFVEMAGALPTDAIKIGLTHGALAIEGKHQPNDFPIALDAASRAGLDYLGVGHWHNWLGETDGGRLVMPGTPEPDQFGQRSGCVAFVEISAAGAQPRVEAVPVATLAWRELEGDFLAAEAARTALTLALGALTPTAARTVVRVILTGPVTSSLLAETQRWLASALAPFLCHQISDRTTLALSAPELLDLQTRHPLLAQVLADLDHLETLATGRPAETSAAAPLSLGEAQTILAPAKIDLAALTFEHFSLARKILFQTLQEVAP